MNADKSVPAAQLWRFVWQAILPARQGGLHATTGQTPAGGLSGRRFRYATNLASLRDGAKHKAGEISANCVSGLFDGGLKGRLQARLPARQGGLHATTGQTPAGALSRGRAALDWTS